jgi:GTP pyrophosphokinase
LDVDKIREAYDLAVEAHSGQRRTSGEEYVTHTVEVATILATLRLDTASLVAGLTHDAVEDTTLSLTDVEARFGAEVATIVDGVTKLGKVQLSELPGVPWTPSLGVLSDLEVAHGYTTAVQSGV